MAGGLFVAMITIFIFPAWEISGIAVVQPRRGRRLKGLSREQVIAMTNGKPEARRISKRKQARRQRKEGRRIARELARLNTDYNKPYWQQPEE